MEESAHGKPPRRSARLSAQSPPATSSTPPKPKRKPPPIPPQDQDPDPDRDRDRDRDREEEEASRRKRRWAESQRSKALELAPDYAFFKPDPEPEPEPEPELEPGDWPGPFSTAMKIINDREKLLLSRKPFNRLPETETEPPVTAPVRRPASLRELCLQRLADLSAEIKSLEGVPDELRIKLSRYLCNLRKMDDQTLPLFFSGSPSEVAVPDCSWATEDLLAAAMTAVTAERLTALELNLSGRCLHDDILSLPSLSCFPALTTISLKGAYRLSDDGLVAVAKAAPRLGSADVGQCSRLTAAGLCEFMRILKGSLRKLFIDDCEPSASSLLPGLKGLESLEALSVAGLQGVTDAFVRTLVAAHGPGLAELGFCRCRVLTEVSVREIARGCPRLRAVDLRDLVKVDDRALAHLAGSAAALRRLLLRRNPLSDKAVAAFLEASGGSLTELSVNNIKEASNFTAQAVATRCAVNLRRLDLSFCRRMTNEGLALIAGSCSSLTTLKLFGCPQISPVFVAGLQSHRLHVVGVEGPILLSMSEEYH